MSPVDGMMLLRRLRRHARSPDRIVSFIMLSGHSASHKLSEARDNAATEFLARPFSMTMLAQKLQRVIERYGKSA